MAIPHRSFLVDALTDFGSTAVASATTGYSDPVDLKTTTLTTFDVVLDITTLVVDDADETYVVALQLGNTEAFDDATAERGCIRLSAAASSIPGRFTIGLDNAVGGVGYRWARLAVTAAGTSPSIAVRGFMSMHGGAF